jgi:hypothetical protein
MLQNVEISSLNDTVSHHRRPVSSTFAYQPLCVMGDFASERRFYVGSELLLVMVFIFAVTKSLAWLFWNDLSNGKWKRDLELRMGEVCIGQGHWKQLQEKRRSRA